MAAADPASAGPAWDWDVRDPEVQADQLRAYDRMRAGCPVAHSEHLGWSVFRHADVEAIALDHATYSSRVSAAHPAVPNGYDPPDHDEYRTLVDRYFDDGDVAGYASSFQTIARELTDALPDDADVEFIDGFALDYALRTQQAWLHWPDYTQLALRDWVARNQRATLAGDRAAIEEVARDFDDTVRRVIADRRAQPATSSGSGSGSGDDPTSRLLRETIDGEPLSEELIVSILRNWTVGELGTMAASVGILVDHLARHPDLQESLRNSPEELTAAIDEILRIHSPLVSNRRVTTRPVELGGRRIDAGERITIFWASANRDEAVFGDPDAYRPEVNAPHNVLYGRGIHACPGAGLARLELRVALSALLAGTRRMELVPGPPDYAAYPASGFHTLLLRITR
ncbi:hypothetical protein BKA04_001712 [Cryobacterium mesophilum]|uniref:cytochrome P450 n=1 Tax=Terrimesophilobacter mesophilus TaxID=433647 RepID=UPI00183B9FFC|nr:cytochrome P450 [Terrimesophilobacter mesophilus]MBB5633489.1 hypothetical protein [Terrimesophilobacter mesophilus]